MLLSPPHLKVDEQLVVVQYGVPLLPLGVVLEVVEPGTESLLHDHHDVVHGDHAGGAQDEEIGQL